MSKATIAAVCLFMIFTSNTIRAEEYEKEMLDYNDSSFKNSDNLFKNTEMKPENKYNIHSFIKRSASVVSIPKYKEQQETPKKFQNIAPKRKQNPLLNKAKVDSEAKDNNSMGNKPKKSKAGKDHIIYRPNRKMRKYNKEKNVEWEEKSQNNYNRNRKSGDKQAAKSTFYSTNITDNKNKPFIISKKFQNTYSQNGKTAVNNLTKLRTHNARYKIPKDQGKANGLQEKYNFLHKFQNTGKNVKGFKDFKLIRNTGKKYGKLASLSVDSTDNQKDHAIKSGKTTSGNNPKRLLKMQNGSPKTGYQITNSQLPKRNNSVKFSKKFNKYEHNNKNFNALHSNRHHSPEENTNVSVKGIHKKMRHINNNSLNNRYFNYNSKANAEKQNKKHVHTGNTKAEKSIDISISSKSNQSSPVSLKPKRKIGLSRYKPSHVAVINKADTVVRKVRVPRKLEGDIKQDKENILYEVRDFILKNFLKRKRKRASKNVDNLQESSNELDSEEAGGKDVVILNDVKDFVVNNFHSRKIKRKDTGESKSDYITSINPKMNADKKPDSNEFDIEAMCNGTNISYDELLKFNLTEYCQNLANSNITSKVGNERDIDSVTLASTSSNYEYDDDAKNKASEENNDYSEVGVSSEREIITVSSDIITGNTMYRIRKFTSFDTEEELATVQPYTIYSSSLRYDSRSKKNRDIDDNLTSEMSGSSSVNNEFSEATSDISTSEGTDSQKSSDSELNSQDSTPEYQSSTTTEENTDSYEQNVNDSNELTTDLFSTTQITQGNEIYSSSESSYNNSDEDTDNYTGDDTTAVLSTFSAFDMTSTSSAGAQNRRFIQEITLSQLHSSSESFSETSTNDSPVNYETNLAASEKPRDASVETESELENVTTDTFKAGLNGMHMEKASSIGTTVKYDSKKVAREVENTESFPEYDYEMSEKQDESSLGEEEETSAQNEAEYEDQVTELEMHKDLKPIDKYEIQQNRKEPESSKELRDSLENSPENQKLSEESENLDLKVNTEGNDDETDSEIDNTEIPNKEIITRVVSNHRTSKMNLQNSEISENLKDNAEKGENKEEYDDDFVPTTLESAITETSEISTVIERRNSKKVSKGRKEHQISTNINTEENAYALHGKQNNAKRTSDYDTSTDTNEDTFFTSNEILDYEFVNVTDASELKAKKTINIPKASSAKTFKLKSDETKLEKQDKNGGRDNSYRILNENSNAKQRLIPYLGSNHFKTEVNTMKNSRDNMASLQDYEDYEENSQNYESTFSSPDYAAISPEKMYTSNVKELDNVNYDYDMLNNTEINPSIGPKAVKNENPDYESDYLDAIASSVSSSTNVIKKHVTRLPLTLSSSEFISYSSNNIANNGDVASPHKRLRELLTSLIKKKHNIDEYKASSNHELNKRRTRKARAALNINQTTLRTDPEHRISPIWTWLLAVASVLIISLFTVGIFYLKHCKRKGNSDKILSDDLKEVIADRENNLSPCLFEDEKEMNERWENEKDHILHFIDRQLQNCEISETLNRKCSEIDHFI